MTGLYQLVERPGQVPDAVLRPVDGGADRVFSTRYRTVDIGTTKPTADLTGTLPGSTLIPVSGMTNTVAGYFENYDFQGPFINQAPGVTVLRNCRIRRLVDPGSATGVVTNQRFDSFLVLIDCEISCTVSTPFVTGVLGGNITALRCKVHDVVDMFGIYCTDTDPTGPTNTVIEGCYGYDLTYYSPDASHVDTDNNTHNDGIQLQGGSGMVARGNWFDMTQGPLSYYDPVLGHPSGGLIGQGVTVTPTRGATHSFLIEANWLNHGIRGVIAEGPLVNISGSVVGNRFGRAILDNPAAPYGPIVTRTGFFTAAGNVYDDDGSPATIYYRS